MEFAYGAGMAGKNIGQRAGDLMHEVRTLLLGHREGEVFGGGSVSDVEMGSMYSRVRSLVEAIDILLDAGHPVEAVALGRALFTQSLHLQELSETDREGRDALVLDAMNRTAAKFEQVDEEALRVGLKSSDETRLKEEIQQRRKELQRLQQDLGVQRLRRFPEDKDLARKHGRAEEYVSYLISHGFVHGMGYAQMFRRVRVEQDDKVVERVYLRSANQAWVASVAIFTMRSALLAHEATARIFDWKDFGERSAQLLRQVSELEKDLDGSPPE